MSGSTSKCLTALYQFWKNYFHELNFVSFDVTSRCNLHCQHCYFREQGHQEELPEKEFKELVQRVRRQYPGIYHASWVGGEPLLRAHLVEWGSRLFPFNMVVTNGTIPLPKWPNVLFHVSLDGPPSIHNAIRGPTYAQIKRHILQGLADGIPIGIACVINKKNTPYLGEFIEEWQGSGIRSMAFDFYTPIAGRPSELIVELDERIPIIKLLRKIGKQYPGLISGAQSWIVNMLPANVPRYVGDRKSVV